MEKNKRLIVIPTMNDSTGFVRIIEDTDHYVVALKTKCHIVPERNKIRELIEEDIIYHSVMGACENFIRCKTKFGSNHKIYLVDGITYDVTFKFD